MIDVTSLEKALCHAYCSSITVRAVPYGYAVSTTMVDRSGDPIGCYIVEGEDGYRLEDDGEYLARMVGSGLQFEQGQRGKILDDILSEGQAFWDRDDYLIRSHNISSSELGVRLIEFISSLIRVRDLELLTYERIRSTFREDVIHALRERYGEVAEFQENTAVDEQFHEFPSDLIITPYCKSSFKGAVYAITSNDRINEALLLLLDAKDKRRSDFKIIAIIEDVDMKVIKRGNFQRAQNRFLSMPIYRGDEQAAIERVGIELGLAA